MEPAKGLEPLTSGLRNRVLLLLSGGHPSKKESQRSPIHNSMVAGFWIRPLLLSFSLACVTQLRQGCCLLGPAGGFPESRDRLSMPKTLSAFDFRARTTGRTLAPAAVGI